MANKKISELQSRTPALSDLMLVGDPSSGYSYKCTVTALATIIETDIADGYVTIGTTQTISGAKTFSNNLTLTSVVNTPTDPDKFLTLNASNVVTYRTGAEVLSDIGGVGGSGTTNYLPKFSATTTLANSQIFDNGTNIGIATATPDATARVQIDKTDGYGLYLNYNTSTGSGVTTTALYAINTTASSGYAAVIEEKTPNTTAGQYPFVIKHSLSSGTAGVGFGTGVHFQLLDDAGTSKTTQLTIENIDAAAATYKTRYRFNVQNNGSSTPVVYINGTGLGVFTASPSVALDVTGEGKFSTINNATTDTDKFLVSDSGVLKYRTGAEVLSDIGGQGALTLTTSGSSGAATLVGNTLNIPNYGSALSGYVPYTGATTNVNLGTRYLQANYLVVDGQSNATGINFKQYSSVSFNGDGYTAMGPVSVDKMFFNFAQGSNIFKIFYFDVSGITGNATRAYTMPNSDGTLALTSQIPTVSGTTNYIPKFTSSSAIGNSQIFDNGTSVGIGVSTINVESKLSVAGGAIIVSGNTGTDRQVMELTTSSGVALLKASYVGSSSFGDLAFSTGGSERMRLTSGGNLGIGTSSPNIGGVNKALTLNSAASTNASYELAVNGTQLGAYFTLASSNAIGLYATQNGHIQFGTNNTERMRLDASGNLIVGGTSASNRKFSVIGTPEATSGILAGFQGVSTGALKLHITDGTSWNWTIGGNSTGNFVFTSGEYPGNAGTTRMTLDASGNLGLGVTPSAWYNTGNYVALQVGNASLIGRNSANSELYLGANVYVNSSGNATYITSDFATRYIQNDGTHAWFNAPSGTAGSAISFTQAMTLDASGRLLVGQTTAYTTAKVQVGGANSTTSANSIFAVQKTNEGYGMYFGVAGSGTSWIQSSDATETYRYSLALNPNGGNVGIGTTSPASFLQIGTYASAGKYIDVATLPSVPSNYLLTLTPPSTTNYYGGGIGWSEGTNTAAAINAYDDGAAGALGLSIATGSNSAIAERMRITSGGNVGIGTTSPDTRTNIVKNALTKSWSADADDILAIENNGTTLVDIRSSNAAAGYVSFSDGDARARGLITYSHASDDMRFNTAGSERMRITSGGNVGIGTTSPSTKLDVQGSNGVIASFVGTSGNYGQIYSDGNAAVFGASTTTSLGNNYLYINPSSNFQAFVTNSTERMRLTSAGELLINTTSDAGDYKLQVNGSTLATNYWTPVSASNGYYLLNYNTSNASSRNWRISNDVDTFGDFGVQVATTQGGSTYTNSLILTSTTAVFNGSIKTAAPSGGTAKPIKFGEIVTLGGSNTQGVRVEIDGTVYYLVTGYLP